MSENTNADIVKFNKLCDIFTKLYKKSLEKEIIKKCDMCGKENQLIFFNITKDMKSLGMLADSDVFDQTHICAKSCSAYYMQVFNMTLKLYQKINAQSS